MSGEVVSRGKQQVKMMHCIPSPRVSIWDLLSALLCFYLNEISGITETQQVFKIYGQYMERYTLYD